MLQSKNTSARLIGSNQARRTDHQSKIAPYGTSLLARPPLTAIFLQPSSTRPTYDTHRTTNDMTCRLVDMSLCSIVDVEEASRYHRRQHYTMN